SPHRRKPRLAVVAVAAPRAGGVLARPPQPDQGAPFLSPPPPRPPHRRPVAGPRWAAETFRPRSRPAQRRAEPDSSRNGDGGRAGGMGRRARGRGRGPG